MKQIWINKGGSFEEANKFEAEYYKGLSSEARVEIVQLLWEMHFKSMGLKFGEDGKRLRKFLSVITNHLKNASNTQ